MPIGWRCYPKSKERGIDIDGLEWFDRAKDTETLAQGLMRNYKGDRDPTSYMKAIGVL